VSARRLINWSPRSTGISRARAARKAFEQRRQALAEHPGSELDLVRDWVRGFLFGSSRREEARSEKSEIRNPKSEIGQSLLTSAATNSEFRYLDEVAAILFLRQQLKRTVVKAATSQAIDGIKGSHGLIQGSKYQFDYLNFQERLQKFERDVVPRFEKFHALKQELIERERAKLRLDEFKPRVLTSFVRNQLIDQIYLPMVGDNLAKQIGAAGAAKRTDLMGLLLVISPPGYGKTTLDGIHRQPAGHHLHQDQRPGARAQCRVARSRGSAERRRARGDHQVESRAGDGRQRDDLRGRHPALQPGVFAEVHFAVRRSAPHRRRLARQSRALTICADARSWW
jgi:hypothetical protein